MFRLDSRKRSDSLTKEVKHANRASIEQIQGLNNITLRQ